MCWSGEASTVLAVVGFSGTAYAVYKKEPPELWVALLYFSLMEALQAFTYGVIDECALPSNQVATLLGYLHIAFQPFFINAVSLYFIPPEVRKRIATLVYLLCFCSAVFMIIQLYPFDWAGSCHLGRPLCGEKLCSVSGEWHIAWEVPANGIGNFFQEQGWRFFNSGYLTYTLVGFFLPLLYGSWRFTLYHLALGPFLASTLTDDINEWPAVWCLLSIGLLLLVVKGPFRKWLHVGKPYWWREEISHEQNNTSNPER